MPQIRLDLWFVSCVLLGMGLITPPASASEFCKDAWTFQDNSLQEARRRMKSPIHKQVADKVSCGLTIRDALSLSSTDFPTQCITCEQEYVQFLRDFISFTRRAAERSTSETLRRKYYETEIEAHHTLNDFLLSDREDKSLVQKYWSSNFEGLGDAMERIGLGKQFHDEALEMSQKYVMSGKSYKTWARAIRSCKSWNFTAGENLAFNKLPAVLCVDECRFALTGIRSRVNEGHVENKVLMNEILAGMLPTVESCSSVPQK